MNLKDKFFLKQLFIVLGFNFIILLFIAKKYLSFLESSEGFLTKFYLIISTFSHFFIINALPFLLSCLLFLIVKRTIVTAIFNILLSTILLIYIQLDTIVFGQFRYHISPMVLKMVFGKRSGDIFQFSTENILFGVGFVFLILLLQIFFHFLAKKIVAKKQNLGIKPIFITAICCLLIGNSIYAWSDANYYGPITQTKEVFPIYFPLTADNLMLKLGLVDLEKNKNKSISTDFNSNTIKYPLKSIVSENPSKKNILYIVIDTWRYDCMNAAITPNIYDFSKKSMVYDNHMSGSNMTTGGIFSLFYGIPATYFYNFTSQEIPPVMMTELQKQNYQFEIFSSSTLENPPFNRNVFAKINNIPLFTEGDSPSERDENINNLWLSEIEKRDPKKPFFGFLFYDSAHGFDYPKNYDKPFLPDLDEVNYLDFDDDYNPRLLKNRYKNAIHYVDDLIGKVIKQLEDKNLLENTIIVITSDHGQEFNDSKKGYWQHGGNFSDYQIRVPMLIYDATKSPKTETNLTLHYDIAPTILKNYLGVQNQSSEFSYGQDLFEPFQKRDYFICGYNQKYSIIEKNKITNISPSGTLDVTDKKLNKLSDDKINYNTVGESLKSVSKFYKKK